jgi:hypothetical protein
MLEVESLSFTDLTDEEKQSVPNNGAGKEYASYIKVTHNGKTLYLESDAVEPEDATFYRDFGWVSAAIQKAYDLGKADAIK